MTSPKLPKPAWGVPGYIARARQAYDVFMKSDLPTAKLPTHFILYAKVKEKEWNNYIESIEGPLDRIFFSATEREQGDIMIASSAGVILAFERLTKRPSAARAILAKPAKGWHVWTPLAAGLVGLLGSYFVIGRSG